MNDYKSMMAEGFSWDSRILRRLMKQRGWTQPCKARPYTEYQRKQNDALWQAIESTSYWRTLIKPGVYYVIQHNDTGKLFSGFVGGKNARAKWTTDTDKACRYLIDWGDSGAMYLRNRYGENASHVLLSEWLANRPKKGTRKARVSSVREVAVIENVRQDLGNLVSMLQAGKVSDGLELAEGLLFVVNQ